MTPDELERVLAPSGISCRVKGDEVLVEVCLFCANSRWNLELNAEKGVYHCWACRASGRLDKLLRQFTGDDYQIPVALTARQAAAPALRAPSPEFTVLPIDQVPSAASYLARRGLGLDAAREYGLVVCVEQGHRLENRIVVPARDFWTRMVVGWAGRTYTGRRAKYLFDLPTPTPITGWRRVAWKVPVIVVEGHFDGIAAHQAGYSAAVLAGTWNPSFELWAARLMPETPVVVMLDGSAAQEGRRLFWEVCAVRSGSQHAFFAPTNPGSDPANLGPQGIRTIIEGTVRRE